MILRFHLEPRPEPLPTPLPNTMPKRLYQQRQEARGDRIGRQSLHVPGFTAAVLCGHVDGRDEVVADR